MLMLKRIQYVILFALSVCCSMQYVSGAQGQEKAIDTTPTVKGKVSICKEIDDDWKCVGQSNQWAADSPFNILFENQGPVGVYFIGMVFYKQGADGKDVEFINEYRQDIGEKNSKYATTTDELKLAPGIYSVYIISWDKRELTMKRGNLTEYLAKTVLTVK